MEKNCTTWATTRQGFRKETDWVIAWKAGKSSYSRSVTTKKSKEETNPHQEESQEEHSVLVLSTESLRDDHRTILEMGTLLVSKDQPQRGLKDPRATAG